MICFPNAKINIGLHVTEKRADGYHNIESFFYPIGLCDVLEVVENKKRGRSNAEIKITGIKVKGSAATNLCIRAYELIKKEFDLPPVKIHLHKCIPVGAGLGGGSSDAAFFIKLLNDKFNLQLNQGKMIGYARQLGSDCAFFINNKPVIASQKGDVFENTSNIILGGHLLLVHPEIHVSTVNAYGWIKPKQRTTKLKKLLMGDIHSWKKAIVNDFEQPIFEKFPEINSIKEKMYELGAYYASMTGSGSAVFGLFETPPVAEKHFKKYFSWQQSLNNVR